MVNLNMCIKGCPKYVYCKHACSLRNYDYVSCFVVISIIVVDMQLVLPSIHRISVGSAELWHEAYGGRMA